MFCFSETKIKFWHCSNCWAYEAFHIAFLWGCLSKLQILYFGTCCCQTLIFVNIFELKLIAVANYYHNMFDVVSIMSNTYVFIYIYPSLKVGCIAFQCRL